MSHESGPPWAPSLPDPAPSGPARMGVGRVLEVGTRILRRHWAVLLAAAALFVGPGALLTSATSAGFLDVFDDVFVDPESGQLATDLAITAAERDRLIEALLPVLGASLLAGALATIGSLAFSAVVAEDYHARAPRLGPVLGRTLARVPSAVVFMLVTSLLVAGIAAAGLLAMTAATALLPGSGQGGPGVFLALVAAVAAGGAIAYLTLRWLPAYPVMVEEDAGWREALRRSWHLSADNVLRLLAVFAIAVMAGAFLDYLLGAILLLVLEAVLTSGLGLDAMVTSTLALALAAVVVAPLAPVLVAVQYFDLRTRRDPAVSESAGGPLGAEE